MGAHDRSAAPAPLLRQRQALLRGGQAVARPRLVSPWFASLRAAQNAAAPSAVDARRRYCVGDMPILRRNITVKALAVS